MNSSSESVQALLDRAMESTSAKRFGEAGERFFEAMKVIEKGEEGLERRKQLGFVAQLCARNGHPDLALMALDQLLQSLERRKDPALHCTDLLALANSWENLGWTSASSKVNEIILAHALKHRLFGAAASASTNLAINDANSGRLPESLRRLQESLELLAKGSNSDTEAITRLFLIQVVDAIQGDPKIGLDGSAPLFTRLERHVGPERWKGAAPAFHRLVERYLQAHPEIDADDWKRTTFPRVFRGRA